MANLQAQQQAMMKQMLEKTLLEAAKTAEDQVDAQIERLDQLKEDDLEGIRQRRLEALRRHEQKKKEWLQKGHGEYSELADETEFFETCKKSENVVVHFYREETFRCKIVDKHLSVLAKKHVETKFCKISVDRSPFLCERMKIRVLPTIVCFKDFKSTDHIIGFDDLGGHDEFSTEMMEWRLGRAKVINYSGDLESPPDFENKTKSKPNPLMHRKTIRGKKRNDDDESSDDE